MLKKIISCLCIFVFIVFPYQKNSIALQYDENLYDLYWTIPSSVQVSRTYEEFTLLEFSRLEIAALLLNQQSGSYSHTVFSPCGGAVHLHERGTNELFKFYPTLRTTSYYVEQGKEEKHVIFLTAIHNMKGEWLVFHFDIYHDLQIRGLFIDSVGKIVWKQLDETTLECTPEDYYSMFTCVREFFQQKKWTSAEKLLRYCFSGKLWENSIYACNCVEEDCKLDYFPQDDFCVASNPDELCSFSDKNFDKVLIVDYQFTKEDKEHLATFLNTTREMMDYTFTSTNYLAYADECYRLDNEDGKWLYIGEITYCPIPEAFAYCCLKALKNPDGEWMFSYTTDTMINDTVYIKTYGVSPLIENCDKQNILYFEYLNNLGMIGLNNEPFTMDHWITSMFSFRMNDMCSIIED